MDSAKEFTGLGTLDDSVVIGGCQCHDLRNRIASNGLRGGTGPFGWILHGADPDYAALSHHQSGDGVVCSDGARVG